MAADRSTVSVTLSLPNKLQTAILMCFHLLFLVTPFFFTWVNEELFEFNKMILTYGLTALILGLWAAKMWASRKWLIKRTPLDLPLGLFVISQVVSTLLSINLHTSLFGYYTRFHGGLFSTLTYVALYYAFVSNIEKVHLKQVLITILLGGLGASLYAIPEHFGMSPSCLLIAQEFNAQCWVQDVQNRVFGTFGQPNWLAAYVILLWPLAVSVSLTESLKTDSRPSRSVWRRPILWLAGLTSIALFVTLLFTKSRSGLLGFVLGGAVYSLGTIVLLAPGLSSILSKKLAFLPFNKAWFPTVDQESNNQVSPKRMNNSFWSLLSVLLGSVAVFALLFGTPYSPSLRQIFSNQMAETPATAPPPELQPSNRLEVGGTDSGEIRKIVWQGAVGVWKRYPLFGSGVETFAYSYYQDRPAAHNVVSEWDFLYNKAHNEFLNFLATTGIVGLACYVALLLVSCYLLLLGILSLKSIQDRFLLLALLTGIVALSVSNFLGFSTVVVTTLLFVFMALAVVITEKTNSLKLSHLLPNGLKQFLLQHPRIIWSLIIIFTVWLLWNITNWWLADVDFARGKRLIEAGQTSAGLGSLQTASRRMPNEPVFLDELSITYAQLAVAYHQSEETDVVPELQQAAELTSDKTIVLNSHHLNFLKNRARVFILLSEIQPEAMVKAEKTLLYAQTLAPTDAKLLYNLALVQAALNKTPEAIATLEKTVALKTNYEAAYLELGNQYELLQEWSKAQTTYQYVLDRISADNPTALARVAALEASVSAQKK